MVMNVEKLRLMSVAMLFLVVAGCSGTGCGGKATTDGKEPIMELGLGCGKGRVCPASAVGFDVRGWPIMPDLDPDALVLNSVSAMDGSGTVLPWTPKVAPGWKDGTHFLVYVNAATAVEPVTIKGSLTYKGRSYIVEMVWRKQKYTFAGKTEVEWTAASARLRQEAGLPSPEKRAK